MSRGLRPGRRGAAIHKAQVDLRLPNEHVDPCSPLLITHLVWMNAEVSLECLNFIPSVFSSCKRRRHQEIISLLLVYVVFLMVISFSFTIESE